jgi:hypothetical protein
LHKKIGVSIYLQKQAMRESYVALVLIYCHVDGKFNIDMQVSSIWIGGCHKFRKARDV